MEKELNCDNCYKSFLLKDFRQLRPISGNFCSSLCKSLKYGFRVKKICEFCGQNFIFKLSNDNRHIKRGRFCNKHCFDSFQRRNQSFKDCLFCGKKFKLKQWQRNPNKFCSKFCSSKYRIRPILDKFRSGELKNGGSKYYRELAFSAYKHECSKCGYKEYEKILEVHHVDSDRRNNDLSNLCILCPNCHSIQTYINRGIILT